jgi:hypothetical protein
MDGGDNINGRCCRHFFCQDPTDKTRKDVNGNENGEEKKDKGEDGKDPREDIIVTLAEKVQEPCPDSNEDELDKQCEKTKAK